MGIKLLKEDLSKILIKNNIIGRYSVDPMHRGGAEGFLRGSGHSHLINSDKLLEDLSYYIMSIGTTKKKKKKK